MNTTQKTTPPGFQSLADLRALVLALGELREAAALGLPLPPPSDTGLPRHKGAPKGAR